MDSDVEQLGQIAAVIVLAGAGAFMLLQAIRSWWSNAPPKADDGDVDPTPTDRPTTA